MVKARMPPSISMYISHVCNCRLYLFLFLSSSLAALAGWQLRLHFFNGRLEADFNEGHGQNFLVVKHVVNPCSLVSDKLIANIW